MDPASVVGLVASIVALIDTTIEVVKFLNDVNDAPKEWTAFAQEASDLLSILTTLRYTVSDVTIDDPWFAGIRSLARKDGPLDQFHESLTELTKRLRPNSSGVELKRRLLWSFDKKYITEKFTRLERLKSLINVALNRDQIGLLQVMKDDVGTLAATATHTSSQLQDVQNHLNSEQWKKFLDWVSPLTYSAKQTDAFSRCQAGSYQWLLALPEFQDWMLNGSSILWGCGMPGAGKTTFTSFLVEKLSQSAAIGVRILYVYFNYKEPAQNPSNVVGALVRQILEQENDHNNSLWIKYNDRKKQEPATINDMRQFLYESLDRCSNIYVLFDALDEYDEGIGDRSELVEDLFKLSKHPATHVLVTSRWLASLQRDLSNSACIEIRASESDVEAYVKTQIQSSARLRSHTRQDETLEADITNAVVASCQGMFLLAKLHMDSLSTKVNRRAIRQALSNLPKKLEDTYLLVFERIEAQNEDDASLAFQLLTWLTYSRRPLTVREIQDAIAVNIGDDRLNRDDLVDEEILLSVCAGIVSIEEQSNIIRLIHYTAAEYLRSIRQTHHMLNDGHLYTTNVCATYLGSVDFEDAVELEKFPFYKYAANFWAEHAKENAEEVSQKEILKFLTHDTKVSTAAKAVNISSWYKPPVYYGIHLSAQVGLAITLNALLAMGIDGLLCDSHGQTTLHYACKNQHVSVVCVILDHQDIAKRLQTAWLALHLAVSYQFNQLVEIIMSKYIDNLGGSISFAKGYLGRTPLHRTVSRNCFHSRSIEANSSSIGLLLSKLPTMIDLSDDFGMTALHCASICGDEKAAEALLLNGASPNMSDKYQATPLLYAVQRDHAAMVELLIKYGAAERVSPSSSSLLAAAELGNSKLLNILLARYLTAINEPDGSGWTALHYATASREPKVIDLLQNAGAVTDLRACDGLTARDVASLSKMPDARIFGNHNRSKDGKESDPADISTTDTQTGVGDLKAKAMELFKDLVSEGKAFIDYDTFSQTLEMDDETDDGRFCHTLFMDYVAQARHVNFCLGEVLFVRDLQQVFSIYDAYGCVCRVLGYIGSERIWKQINDIVHDVCFENVHFDSALISKMDSLVFELKESCQQEGEFIHRFGKLPYMIGDHLKQVLGTAETSIEAPPQSSTNEDDTERSSEVILPQRRQSI